MSGPAVLVIDDDPALRRVMKIALQALDYEVALAPTGAAGLSEAALRLPAAIVLDLGLPDIDGVELCRRLREWTDVPVVVLSADATEDRKIEALDSGADDYVTKPFSMGELQARLRVALRRAERAAASPEKESGGIIETGPLRLDQVHHEAWLNGRPIELTGREFAFLAYLAGNEGRVCTQHMILSAVWGPGYVKETQYLREYAYRLRRKLGDEEGAMLRTRPGIGYQLVAPEGSADPGEGEA